MSENKEETEVDYKVIDGRAISNQIKEEVKQKVEELREITGAVPGLAVIMVGENRDSATYVRMKTKACENAGFESFNITLPVETTQQEIIDQISQFNKDPRIHGILVQMPLPSHINEHDVIENIVPEKDVDGLHPYNVGGLMLKGPEQTNFVACTPLGIIEILKRSNVEISGKVAVVLGRSNIVGKPISHLLQFYNATVIMCHSKTRDLPYFVRQADILVVAMGKPEMVKAEWLKPRCVVIDVGMNAIEDSSKKTGYRLVGDVDYEKSKEIASKITPVPGGVGPCTIAMLLSNTMKSASRYLKERIEVAAMRRDEEKAAISAIAASERDRLIEEVDKLLMDAEKVDEVQEETKVEEEKPEENPEEKPEENSEEKLDENPEEKPEENPEEKLDENPEEQQPDENDKVEEEKPEENPEEKQEKPEEQQPDENDKVEEEKPEENPEEKLDENPEQQPEENPEEYPEKKLDENPGDEKSIEE